MKAVLRFATRLLFLVALASAVALPGSQVSAQEEGEAPLIVEEAENGVVAVTLDSPELELILSVATTGKLAVRDVNVDVGRLRIAGTAMSAPMKLFSGENALNPEDTFDVSVERAKPIIVRASLPRSGAYSGLVTFVVGGERITTELAVTFDEPAFTIEEAKDGAVEVKVDTAAVDLPLRALAPGGVDQPAVVVEISTLMIVGTTTSAELAATVDAQPLTSGGTIDIPAGAGRRLRLSTTLPQPGVYEGAVVLRQATKRSRTAITITYGEPPAPTIEIDPVDVIRGQSFDVTLRETGHRRVVLDRPSLVHVRRSLSDELDEAVVPSSVTFDIVGSDGQLSRLGEQTVVDADDPLTLRVRVRGLDAPGSYDGDLSFTVGGAQKGVSTPISFVRRRSAWWAGVLLVAGVGLAETMRQMVLVHRTRLTVQVAVNRWHDKLQSIIAGLPPDERACPEVQRTVESLRRQVLELATRAGAGDLTEAETTTETETFAGRLALLPRWSAAVASASKAKVLVDAATDLAVTSNYVGLGFSSNEQAVAAVDRLRARAAAGLASEESRDLIRHLAMRKGRVPTALETSRGEAETAAVNAKTLLGQSEFTNARDAYDEAWTKWATGLREIARDTVTSSPPVGNGDAHWADLVEATRTELSATRQPSEVEAALEPLFQRYGLRVAHAIVVASPPGGSPVLPDGVDAAATRAKKRELDAAVAELNSALTYGVGTDVLRRAEAAVTAFRAMTEAIGATGSLETLGVRDVETDAEWSPSADIEITGELLFGEHPETRDVVAPVVDPPNVSSLRRTIDRIDRTVAAAAALAAIALGMLFLYAPNFSWGDGKDMLTLFLWGLGVHQVAGVTGSIAARKLVRTGLDGS